MHHRLWRVTAPAVVEAHRRRAWPSAPVVIADGHHRYETSLAYRDEAGRGPGPADLTLALVVELRPSSSTCGPSTGCCTGLPPDLDLVDALSPCVRRVRDAAARRLAPGPDGRRRRPRARASRGGRRWLLRPRRRRSPTAARPRLEPARRRPGRPPRARRRLPARRSTPCWPRWTAGEAEAGVLLRPATVAQIAATAHGGDRMPPKTTFFYPKPRTGFVFRPV